MACLVEEIYLHIGKCIVCRMVALHRESGFRVGGAVAWDTNPLFPLLEREIDMNKVYTLVLGLLAYCLGHHIGEERLRLRLSLAEQSLKTFEEQVLLKDYLLNKCTSDYLESTSEPFKVGLKEFMDDYVAKNTLFSEKEFHKIKKFIDFRI